MSGGPLVYLTDSRAAAMMLEALRSDPVYRQIRGASHFYTSLASGQWPGAYPASGHRRLLRLRLQNSGLAQCLPAGLDLLPDIFAANSWMRWCAPFLRPRNTRQLTQHVCAFLDWYCWPETVVLPPARVLACAALSSFGRAFMWGLVLLLTGLVILWGMVAILTLVPLLLLLLAFLLSIWARRLAYGQAYVQHSEELFIHLLESYITPQGSERLALAQAGHAGSARVRILTSDLSALAAADLPTPAEALNSGEHRAEQRT